MTSNIYVATIFCVLACFSTASADTIRLTFSGSGVCPSGEMCEPVFDSGAFVMVGDTVSGSGTILQVTGPDDGSFPISGGFLRFETAPAYSASVTEIGDGGAFEFRGESGAGGHFEIGGSVFGLDPGTTLLSGTFISAACSWSNYHYAGAAGCYAGLRVQYSNPVLLERFGLQSNPDLMGTGSLHGYRYSHIIDGVFSQVDIAVDFSSVPEPSALMLTGLGLLVAGLPYIRRRRTVNHR